MTPIHMLMDVFKLLAYTVESGASDLHLRVGVPPSVRLHGSMDVVPDTEFLSPEDTITMLEQLVPRELRGRLESEKEIDFALEPLGSERFRANVFVERLGYGGVFRVIPRHIKTLEDLQMPPVLGDLCRREKGLILVTGPTGSGKSTTLAAMINLINEERRGHILTIEDPIEFVHQPNNCIITQREVGSHTHSFSNALRSALREDPDVILVGEMRDLETISLAITAAETGHLVFGTLHTMSAPKTVDRIIDAFSADRQEQIRTMLSESLEGVVTQTLLPTADGNGRAAAVEVLTVLPSIRNLIREGKTHQMPSIMQTGASHGMITMEAAINKLVTSGLVTSEVAARRLSIGSVA